MLELKVFNTFLQVASRRKDRYGKFIPLTYWVIKVNKKLEKPIPCQKLLRSLEKLNAINAEFSTDVTKKTGLSKLVWTERRIVRAAGGNPVRVGFLCVITPTVPEEALPLNKTEAGKFFQARYSKYQNRKSILITPTLIIPPPATKKLEENKKAEPPVPRAVTPTEEPIHELYHDSNKDLLGLLQMIIKPEFLSAKILKDGTSANDLRQSIESIGCNIRAAKNKEYYRFLAKDRYDDEIRVGDDGGKYFPLLGRFCCPLSKRAIQSFLKLAINIDEISKESNVLQLQKYGGNGYGQRLVAVVPADTPNNLRKTARRWLPTLYEAIRGTDMSEQTVSFELIKLQRLQNKEAFNDVVRTSRVLAFKMNPYRQIAMFHKNNMTYEHARGMRPYLNADKCNPLHSERTIRRLEVNPDIEPEFTNLMEQGTKRGAWCLPVDTVVVAELKRKANADLDEVHVILSADHGQRAFRCNTAIVQVKDGLQLAESNVLVGHIDCKKDTCTVLEDSQIVSKINKGLTALKAANKKVRLFASGDYAWYSLAIGKENMAGKHCPRCMTRWEDYQKDPHVSGEDWTLEKLNVRYEKLQSGELSRKDKNLERGVMTRPLIDCIEPTDWLFPPLHGLDLLVNAPFSYLNMWVWNRLEVIPMELVEARNERTKMAIQVDELWEDFVSAEEHKMHMEQELSALAPGDTGFDDDDHEQEYSLQDDVLRAAKNTAEVAKEEHEDAVAALKKIKAAVNKLEKKKKFGKATQDLWLTVQRMLRKDFNVYASTYHGGDMEGNEARTLMRKAEPAMDALALVLIDFIGSLTPQERKGRADEHEIELFLSAFKRLFQYMDLLSHFCYQPMGSMTDDDVHMAEKTVRLARDLWYNLMPTIPMKVHMWTHLLEDLKRFRGLKSHNEHGIERAHQTGKKHDRRLACIRDFEKKHSNILRQTATAADPQVVAMHADTEAKKRKRSLEKCRSKDLCVSNGQPVTTLHKVLLVS